MFECLGRSWGSARIAEPPARTNGPHRAPRDVTWDGRCPTRRIRYAVPPSHATRCSGALRTTPQHLVVQHARADPWSLIWTLIQVHAHLVRYAS